MLSICTLATGRTAGHTDPTLDGIANCQFHTPTWLNIGIGGILAGYLRAAGPALPGI